jgi:hypothetical protein
MDTVTGKTASVISSTLIMAALWHGYPPKTTPSDEVPRRGGTMSKYLLSHHWPGLRTTPECSEVWFMKHPD